MILILLGGCGRKERHIFDFPPTTSSSAASISALSIPAIRDLEASVAEEHIHLSWSMPTTPLPAKGTFAGYALYRFQHNKFIPQKPLAVVQQPLYNDTPPFYRQGWSYVVRVVVRVDEHHIEGPASPIVSVLLPTHVKKKRN